MNTLLQGECNCGAVKFELLTSVRSMYKCYCTMCQKQSGTASNAIADKYMWIPVGLIGSVDAKVLVNIFEDTKPQWEEDFVHQTDSKRGVKDADDLFARLNTHK